MIHRAIVAALLVGLGLSARAGQVSGPAYEQAQSLAGGRAQADTAYDGKIPAVGAVQAQTAGALTTGGLAVQDPSAAPVPNRTVMTAPLPDVPSPAAEEPHAHFFSMHGLLYGAGGAAAGAGAGWFLGGPLGAVIGAAAGFLIGFLLSKLLH